MIWLLAMATAGEPNCVVAPSDLASQTQLTYSQFDGNAQQQGWRPLNSRGCTDAAVALLAAYENVNAQTLTIAQRQEIAFHQAQALAFAGRNREAIPYAERAAQGGGTEEWTTYVAATLGYLRGDRAATLAARTRYAAIAPRSDRLRFIDGLLACPERNYMEAAFCAK